MIVIVVSITVMLSILLSAFISFSPNVNYIIERDFVRRTNNNAIQHSLQHSQLSVRARTLAASTTPPTPIPSTDTFEFPLRYMGEAKDNLPENQRITIDVEIKSDPRSQWVEITDIKREFVEEE